MELEPLIESQALDETEKYLREFVQVAINTGLKPMSLVMMLRSVANDFEPKLILPEPAGMQ